MLLTYVVPFIISYLIGSIPTAYLVVKKTSDVDIRKVGSGNVGGRNALEVTGKKWVGIAVVFIDVAKGAFAITIVRLFSPDNTLAISIAMGAVTLGHCYPVWLKFHGGRGLATGAGTLMVTCWVWILFWLGLYFVSSKITKNVHASSVIALVGMPLLGWFLQFGIVTATISTEFSVEQYFAAGSLTAAVCLTRHIKPLKEYFNEKNS